MDKTEVRVRYQETDAMGVVYHANYFVWFEIGRTELLRNAGFSYRELETAGFFLPVRKVDCTYHKPAKYDDLLAVETKLARLTPVRIEFAYNVRRGKDLIASGNTLHAIIDGSGRPQNLSKKNPDLWRKLSNAVADLSS